jgi:NAD(P)-dependent dehydrogenase (short-subunit alcohol dehydrogenase family)
MGKLEGKIALVTGGNGGIGLATAKEFVKDGAYVSKPGAVNPKWLGGRGDRKKCCGVQRDASKLSDLDRLFAQINMLRSGR